MLSFVFVDCVVCVVCCVRAFLIVYICCNWLRCFGHWQAFLCYGCGCVGVFCFVVVCVVVLWFSKCIYRLCN